MKKQAFHFKKEIKTLFNLIRKRNFSGNSGLAVKNSTYQFGIAFFGKFLALLFTAILARVLMPELFGLYSLVLATIFLMISFTDSGIGTALIKFVSPYLGKNNKKASDFSKYFLKLKLILILVVSLFLVVSSKFIAYNYYEKPIFFALLLGPLIIFFYGMTNLLENNFRASNNLKPVFFKEIFFQIARFIFVFGILFLLIGPTMSQEKKLFLIIFGVLISYLFTLGFLSFFSKQKYSLKEIFASKIPIKEKKKIKRFLIPVVVTTLSIMIYNYIDLLILGKIVSSAFIGFYSVSSSLVGALMAFMGFSIVMYPIFSKLDRKRLERGLEKSFRIVFLISSFVAIGTFIFSPLIIKIYLGAIILIQ